MNDLQTCPICGGDRRLNCHVCHSVGYVTAAEAEKLQQTIEREATERSYEAEVWMP